MNASDRLIAYVGCRTTKERHAHGLGLTVFRVPNDESPWEVLQLLEGLPNPSYLCLHPSAPRLYVVHGDYSEISCYAIRSDGLLDFLETNSTEGKNPVHLAISPTCEWLLIANYATGTVVSKRLAPNGDLGETADILHLHGDTGPHPQQDASHPHQIFFSPNGKFIYIPDKGLDKVFTINLNELNGKLSIKHTCQFPPGTGPRHMEMNKSNTMAFIVGELDRTIHCAKVNPENGEVSIKEKFPTTKIKDSKGSSAGIALNEETLQLHVSNRGDDSIVTYDVNESESLLSNPHWIKTGKTPRFISLNDKNLMVANEEGDSIMTISPASNQIKLATLTGSPVCIVFKKIKEAPISRPFKGSGPTPRQL